MTCAQQVDTPSLPCNTCKDLLENPFVLSKNPHAKHIQATHLQRNCLLEISCSLHIPAFIKHDLTEKTKWKSISWDSELWLQCNGFIMSRMINIPNRRLCFRSSHQTQACTLAAAPLFCFIHSVTQHMGVRQGRDPSLEFLGGGFPSLSLHSQLLYGSTGAIGE